MQFYMFHSFRRTSIFKLLLLKEKNPYTRHHLYVNKFTFSITVNKYLHCGGPNVKISKDIQ